jgi:hypothetical protein
MTIDVALPEEKRLSVFAGGSFQGITTSLMNSLRNLLSPNIRNVVVHGMRREHYKLLIAQLREEYEKYGAVITINARPMYDTLDISWPMTSAVTIMTLRPDDLAITHLRELTHDTRVFAITAQPLYTTQLFDYYDVSRQLSIHTRIFTTGYVPEPGPLSLLESFELVQYVAVGKRVTADINAS